MAELRDTPVAAVEKQEASGAGDSLLILGGRIAAVLAGIAVQSCLAWFLLPAGRGAYAVAVLFGGVTAVIVGVGLDKAVQYYISTAQRTLSETIANLLALHGVAALVAIPLGLALLELDLAIWEKAERQSLLLMLCFAPISSASLGLRWALIGVRNFKQFAISNVLAVLLQLALVIPFLKVWDWGVDGALLSLVISVLAASIYNLVVLRRDCGLHFALPTARGMIQLLGYGSRYYVASLGYMANTRIGLVLVAFFLSQTEIGYFSAAIGMIVQAGLISDSVETAVLPRLAADEARRAQLAGQAARITLIATGVPLAILALFCRPIVSILFSAEFLPSVPLILIVIPGLLLWSAGKLLLAYFLSSGKPEVASWTVGAGIAVNVIALLVLLPRYGLAGAAWAMSLGFASRGLIASLAFHAASRVGVRSTWWPQRSDLELLRRLLRMRNGRRAAGAWE